MQKEENDTLITDNKKLLTHWRRLDTNDQFGGPECRSGDTPSISNQQEEAEGTTIDGDKETWRTRSTNR